MKLNLRLASVCLGGLLCVTLPWWASDQYQLHLATLIGVYWILVAGLNLVVGYSGQLSIGHVGLLCIGSYAFAILSGKWGWHPAMGVAFSTAMGEQLVAAITPILLSAARSSRTPASDD